MSLRAKINFAEISDTGRVRDHNEDAIGSDPDIGLMVLADGMGGYNAGAVASGIAVQIVTDMANEGAALQERHGVVMSLGHRHGCSRPAPKRPSAYQGRCRYAPRRGTVFGGARISIAHVGYSRSYRLRDVALIQLTLDHSLLQELVDRGFYSAEEAQRSTNRNYVTRALGVEPTVEVEVHEHEVLPEDIYLLCSDGLPDMVEDEDIHLTISTFNASLDVVGQQLVELANDHVGRDNVSVMLAEVMESSAAKKNLFVKIAGWFRS